MAVYVAGNHGITTSVGYKCKVSYWNWSMNHFILHLIFFLFVCLPILVRLGQDKLSFCEELSYLYVFMCVCVCVIVCVLIVGINMCIITFDQIY